MSLKILSAVALAACLVGCQSSDKPADPAPGAAPGAGTTKPMGAGAKGVEGKSDTIVGGGQATKLPKLNLQIDLPVDSAVTDAIVGEGHMIMGASAPLNVSPAKPDKPKTIDEMKKDIEMFKPLNIKTESLEDGWVVTFENEGSMGKNYWATVRRDIGGKAYICDTSVGQEKQRDAAVAACKTLRQ